MGEYAIRKSDNARVKIGTCEDMYYLRYEDRGKVTPVLGSLDPVQCASELRFRLPFPDEDDIAIGEYKEFKRGQRLYLPGPVSHDEFRDESLLDHPGSIQMRHECGMLINVPCFHGLKLPEVSEPMRVFWNGKSWFLELMQIRPTQGGVKPIVGCRWCGEKWRYEWSDIWDYVPADIRPALRSYRGVDTILQA